MRFFIFMAAMIMLATPVMAQDTEQAEAPAAETKTVRKAVNPHIAVMTEKATKLAEKLTAEEAEALGQIRENFGYIRSIGVARNTVEDAVAQCADKNPDMKDEMNDRFKEWNDGISAALEKQEKNLGAAVSENNFSEPAEVQAYLDSIDDMATYSDEQVKKNIVTTPEACKNLVASMDETSTVILGLITDMSWPGEESGSDAP